MFKLLSLDNSTSKGQEMVGKTHPFTYYGTCFYFGSINSSRVKSITFNESEEMVVETRNSIYKFRKE